MAAAMEIYLRIEDDRRRHLADLGVRVAPSHTVGDVADAIGGHLHLHSGSEVTISKPGLGPLVRGRPIVDAGILSGDTLVLGTVWPRPERTAVAPVLVVASGPDTGLSLRLACGDHLIGRDRSCELVLSDPQVSRRHLLLRVDPGDAVTVEAAAGGRNQVRIDGRPLNGPVPLRPGQVVRLGAGSLVVRSPPPARHGGVDAFGQVPFHRTPYFPEPVQPVVIDAVGDVPCRPEKPRFTYLSAVLPLLMGVSFALLLGNPRYLLFAVFSPVMVFGNNLEQRRRSGRTFAQSVARFDEALASQAKRVDAALAEERRRRYNATPDLALLNDRAAGRSSDLWVRDRNAGDFLAMRIGMGDLPTSVDVVADTEGDADHRDRIVAAHGVTDTIADVPIAIELAELGVVGLVGRADQTSSAAASMAVQAATLHSPEDLVITAALAPGRAIIDWLKWAPHTRSSSSPLAGPHLAQSTVEADALIAELVNEGVRRLSAGGGDASPWLLVLLDRAVEPDAAAVSRLLDLCPRAAMSVLWLTNGEQRVPRQARAVVACRSPLTGRPSRLSFTDPDRPHRLLDLDRIDREFAATTVRALAPLRDASSANAATAIPRVVPLFTAFGIESIDGDWVARQWKTDRGHALVAPIGCTEAGPLLLDLVAHGPHGLIGGTSGAGKSELVMAMVAGLVAHNPPSRVNFLFIDYKGGAASDLFKDAPHTVGYVTNLDGLLARRALTSLRAELNRRMNLLQGRAKDLAEMIDRHPDEAPPSLVIVVDEFATLVKEIPDFVAGIVDIAQRGRSLGIHLLLATQRPSGAVNDNIKANTNLRISLRMLDGGESNSVIGIADAASIPAPLKGRGFARMGPAEPVAFQSAWTGAPLLSASGPPPVGVAPFGPPARPPLPPSGSPPLPPPTQPTAPPAAAEADGTHLDALLTAVTEAADRLGHRSGPAPWLDPLPPAISIEAVRATAASEVAGPPLAPGARIVFGMVDDPAAQAQYPAVVDLAGSGGLIVTGAGGSGKSTLLVTLAVSAALDDHQLGGGHLTIFALDFASRELAGLRRLPQCGAIATGDDIEAVTRVVSLLHTELERRRRAVAEAITSSEAPAGESTVLLLIDGLDALIQTMEQGPVAGGLSQTYADLTGIISDGRQVGIHPVISASRRANVRAAMSAAIADRLTLRQADAQGYAENGIAAADAQDLELAPGQALHNGSTVVQVATLVATTSPDQAPPQSPTPQSRQQRQGSAQRRLAALAGSLTGCVDPRLATAPLPRTVGLLPSSEAERPVIGLADLTGEPFALDLRHDDVSVVGDPRSGRSTALATIGRQAAAAGAEMWVLAGPSSPLTGLTEATMACFDDGDRRLAFIDTLVELATGPVDLSRPRLLLLDDHDLLPEHDRELVAAIQRLLPSVRHAVAGPKPRGFSSNPFLQQVRACRSLIHLRPNDARDAHEVVGFPVRWHPGLPMVEGRGYAVVDRLATMVQLSDPFQT